MIHFYHTHDNNYYDVIIIIIHINVTNFILQSHKKMRLVLSRDDGYL